MTSADWRCVPRVNWMAVTATIPISKMNAMAPPMSKARRRSCRARAGADGRGWAATACWNGRRCIGLRLVLDDLTLIGALARLSGFTDGAPADVKRSLPNRGAFYRKLAASFAKVVQEVGASFQPRHATLI